MTRGSRVGPALRLPAAIAAGVFFGDGPTSSKSRRLASFALGWLGFIGGFLFALNILGHAGVLAIATLCALALAASRADWGGLCGVVVRWPARAVVLLASAFLAYQAISWGAMLAWAIPAWAWAGMVLLLALFAASHLLSKGLPRLVVAAPLGAFIAACLLGWKIESGTVRCSDHRRVSAQPDVTVLLPSVADLAACSGWGRVKPAGHPRKLFPAKTPSSFYTTVQALDRSRGPADPKSVYTGGVCLIALGESRASPAIECRATPRSLYALAYLPKQDRLFMGTHDALLEVSPAPPFEELGRAPAATVVAFLLARGSTPDQVVAFYDAATHPDVFSVEGLGVLKTPPLPTTPDAYRRLPGSSEGLYCVAGLPLPTHPGLGYLALASGRDPLDVRPIGTSDQAPWVRLALFGGCDVDADARLAYVGVSTLGLLAVVDYDSGDILRTHWAGVGVRPVHLEADRRTIYAGGFMNGWVREICASTGRVLRSWRAGRFIRDIVSDPTGDAILVTSNMGIVRIALSGQG